MSDMFKRLLILLAVSLTAPALAQESGSTGTTTEQTTTEDATSEDAASDDTDAGTAERTDGLSTGQDVVNVGSTYVVSAHGDWELRCIRAPEGQKDPCQLYQLLSDQNGNAVAEINLFNLPADDQLAAGATIVTPLETLLTRQLQLSVDGGKPKVYPFTFCTKVGCFSRIGFTAGDVSAFKAGNNAKVLIVPAQAPDQQVELAVSLKGFTAGFAAVTEATKPTE